MVSQPSHAIDQALEVLERIPAKPGEVNGTLEHIIRTAQEFFESDICTICAFNPITQGLISSKTVGRSLNEVYELKFDGKETGSFIQQVLRDGLLIVNNDVGALEECDSVLLPPEDVCTFISLALSNKSRKRPLGIITFYFKYPRGFSESDLEKFRVYVKSASFLLQATWQECHYEEVARIGQNINHHLATPEDIFRELNSFIKNILDESHTLLLAVYHQQTGLIGFYREEAGHLIKMNELMGGACEYVINTQTSIYIQQLSQERELLPYQVIRIPETDLKESLIFVPVTLRGVSLGVISMQHAFPDSYDEKDLFLLRLLATHIALALHNMNLYDNLSRLNEAGRLLTQQPDSEQALSKTAQHILDATSADVVVLYPYDARLRQFILSPVVAGAVQATSIHSMSSQQPLVAELVLRSDTTIFAKDGIDVYKQLQVTREPNNFQQREQMASVAVTTLKDRDEPVGVLYVNFHHAQYFDVTQVLLIEGLALFAAIAVKNAQVYGNLNIRRRTELTILQNIDRELSRILKLEPILTIILQMANGLLKAEYASIMLYNPQTLLLKTTAVLGPNADNRLNTAIHMQDARGITRLVLKNKQPTLVNNVNDPMVQDIYYRYNEDVVSELDVPLLDGEEAIGVLNFESTRGGAFSEEDKAFLLNLAGQTVLAIKNAQLYERESRLAEERLESEKRALSAEEMSSLGQLAYELTHRVGNDLGLVESYVNDIRDVLEAKNLENRAIAEKFEKIVRSARRVLDLSRDLKNEMIKTGNVLADQPEVTHVSTLFDDALEEFKDKFAEHPKIQVQVNTTDDAGYVCIRRSSILNLLHNLILNAIEAMPGGGKLTLHTYADGECIALAVSDTGVGIPHEKLSKVFELSFSSKGSSGFGLWSALRNARRNSGKLSVVSQPGQGTTFTLLLPRINEETL